MRTCSFSSFERRFRFEATGPSGLVTLVIDGAALAVAPDLNPYARSRLVRMIARPDHLTVRPNPPTAVSMDPLSDMLRTVRLTGSVFLSGHFTAPWCIGVEITADECARHLPGRPAQIIGYHVVVEGRMLVGVDGEPPLEVSAGEIVLFPQNDPHILADRRGGRPVSASELIQRSPDGGLSRMVHGGGGVATRIVCGFLASEDSYNPAFLNLAQALKMTYAGTRRANGSRPPCASRRANSQKADWPLPAS